MRGNLLGDFGFGPKFALLGERWLFVLVEFFELAFKRVDAQVDCFFKSIGDF